MVPPTPHLPPSRTLSVLVSAGRLLAVLVPQYITMFFLSGVHEPNHHHPSNTDRDIVEKLRQYKLQLDELE